MNWFDILLLVVMGSSIAAGVAKGFSRQVVGLFSAVIAFVCGLWFYGVAGGIFAPYVSSKSISNLLGFLLVFFGIIILGGLIGIALAKLLKWAGLSWADRLLGLVFGALRGVIIGIVLVMILTAFGPVVSPDSAPHSILNSRLAPYVIGAANVLASLAPRELKDEFRKRYEQANKIWEDMVKEQRKVRELPRSEM